MPTTKSLQPMWPPLLTVWMLALIGPSMTGPGSARLLAAHCSAGVAPRSARWGRAWL